MTRYKDKTLRLAKELEEVLDDERYRNLSFVAAGILLRSAKSYLNRYTEKIYRIRHEYDL